MDDQEKQKSELSKHLRVLKDKLVRFLSPQTPPDVLIIKSHLICEYYLNQILILKGICSADQINNLSFSEKNEKALDKNIIIEKSSYDALKILNKLRNKVGHELEYVLSESDVDSLGFIQGKEYILNKYDFETLAEQLRDTLTDVVINIAVRLFKLVEAQKTASSEMVKQVLAKNS